MSSPFSIASSSGGGPNNVSTNGNNNLQPGANFGYQGTHENNNGNSYMGPNAHSENFHNIQIAMPAGKDDHEILRNLKNMILAGQHHYKPIPQPNKLKEIYEAGLVQDQILRSAGYEGAGYDVYEVGPAPNGTGPKTALSTDAGRKYPLIQTKDAGDVPSALKSVELSGSQAQSKNGRSADSQVKNVPPSPDSKTSNAARTATDSRAPVTSSSDPASPRDRPRNNTVIRGPDSARPSDYDSRPRITSNASAIKSSTYDRRDDRGGHDRQPSHSDVPSDEPSRPDLDRAGPPLGRPSNYPDSREDELRGPGPREQRFYDRERNRERDRDRDRDNDRDWDRGRSRDRREYRPTMTNAPRPPPELRHYEPNYGPDSFPFPRRSDTVRPPPDDAMNVDSKRPLPPPGSATRVGGPIDDRRGRGPMSPPDRHIRPAIADDRDLPPARVPLADSSHSARLSLDDRAARPLPAVRDSDVRPLAPSQSADAARGPPPPLDDRSVRPPVPLEDRITAHGPPSQDRVTQSRADDRILRRPSLEERITHAPNSVINQTLSPQDDRPARPGLADRTVRPVESATRPFQEDRDRVARPDERPIRAGPPLGDRYTPAHDRIPHRGGYVPPARASSVVHDDPRPPRAPLSPPATRSDYRTLPPRAGSRDREVRPAHRPESDRAYNGDRRGDAMDVDNPRSDTRRSSPLPNRALSPPLRGKSVYPPPPPPPLPLLAEPVSYADSDRRYIGDRRDYPEDRQRSFNGPEDDYYSRTDRGPPPVRGHGWETRDERKVTVADSSPIRPYDNTPSRPAQPRPGNTYSDDRTYPPRDFERERYAPPSSESTIARVRPRSPSPIRRVGTIEDDRPPTKRAREEAPYSTGYYTPQPQPRRALSASGPADDYSSRSLPPPRPPSRATYYESRAAPVSPPARAGAPPYERDYSLRDRPTEVVSYVSGPSTYERPRSPPPARAPPVGYNARAGYTRPDPRDDRRYIPPLPRGN